MINDDDVWMLVGIAKTEWPNLMKFGAQIELNLGKNLKCLLSRNSVPVVGRITRM